MRIRSVLLGVAVPVLAIVVAVGAGSWAAGREPDQRSSLTAALDAQPRDVLVVGFTDWAAIRDGLGLGSSTAATRDALTDQASLRDLTTRSVLGGVIGDMHEAYGWSAADLEWESYGQAPGGAAMVARFSDTVSFDAVEARLRGLGYSRDGDLWTIDAAGGTRVGPELARTLGRLALVRDRRLVVAVDRPQRATAVLTTIRDAEPSALSRRPLADVAGALSGSDTAVLQESDFACRATSFDALGPDVLAQVDAAVARAGDLATPTFTGRGLVDGDDDQQIRFVSAFDSPTTAADQARVRSAVATGPFIGRPGRVEDVLDLVRTEVEGSVVDLQFSLDPDRGAFMSGEGPLLFAACPS